MDITDANTAVTTVSIFVTLLGLFGKPVLEKIKESNLFIGSDIITLGNLANNPEDLKTQGKLEGIIETRISSDEGFEAKLKVMLAELQKPETIEHFKYNKQIGDNLKNEQGGEGSKYNNQEGNNIENKQ
jgi:hypothetical protein